MALNVRLIAQAAEARRNALDRAAADLERIVDELERHAAETGRRNGVTYAARELERVNAGSRSLLHRRLRERALDAAFADFDARR